MENNTWLVFFIGFSTIFFHVQTIDKCVNSSQDFSYLFLDDFSQIRIPLAPFDCHLCQKAEKVEIELIDEHVIINRTIQRLTIFLNNFEIDDTTYICLIEFCPIVVEYGSDSLRLNVTATLLSHMFLSLIYFQSSLVLCTIQNRFAVIRSKTALSCTEQIHLHPKKRIVHLANLLIYDCRALTFENSIYRSTIRFFRPQLSIEQTSSTLIIRSTNETCRFLVENRLEFESFPSLKQLEHFFTTVSLISPSFLWKEEMISLESCRTEVIPFQEMFFTDDILHLRTLHLEQGQSISIQCKTLLKAETFIRDFVDTLGPIDGSKEYLKYFWYYERYQPKYQISNHRIIILNNVTEAIQGKYMCIGDDESEKLEFEMTIHVHQPTKNLTLYYPLIIIILIVILIILSIVLSFLIFYLFKCRSNNILRSRDSIGKVSPPSLTVHHDVHVKIEHQSSFDQYVAGSTMDYIDDAPIYSIPSWSPLEQSRSMRKSNEMPCRYSTNHLDIIGQYRNVNGQPIAVSIPLVQSVNLPTIVSSRVQCDQVSSNGNVSTNQVDDDIAMLKISIPYLNTYPLISSSSSIISFDSQVELDQFHRMSLLNMEQPSN